MEWNQPTGKSEKITEPLPLCGEIIQIGAVKLNESFNVSDTFNVMIKPVYYKKMNSSVKKLTGICDNDLQGGIPFSKAYENFLNFCGEDFCLLTWGNDDILVLNANLAIHGIVSEKSPITYNLQRIFGRQIAKTKKQISLENAVATLGEPPYCAHDALNDAISAALVCRHLDLTKEITARPSRKRKKRATHKN